MDTKVHFSTGKDDWETPDDLFAEWHRQYNFQVDLAANRANHKCDRWLGPGGIAEDALRVDWVDLLTEGNAWLNPPYSRGLQAAFVKRAAETIGENDPWFDELAPAIVCLLPARTDTRLFHEVILPNARSVEFLRGRVRFKGASAGAPFPSMIVIF